MKAKQELKLDAVMQILQNNGLLSQQLKGFESREAQQQMMRDIIDAYNNSHISLIEAGTGTGKSIAYLIPAIIWASLYKETTLISTNTINLQEQLIHKDIPLLTKALNLDVKAVLVKGMHNYICLRKLDEARQSLRLYSLEDAAEIERIEECKEMSRDGSRSELPFVPSSHVWEKVNAEKDTCNNRECPHFQECHFFKARRNANDANILVANHHMLFADLICRAEEKNYTKPSIMPPYKRIILDEAHNIEDTATEYFANKTSQWGIMHTLGRLSSEKRGKLPLLKEKFQKHFVKHSAREVAPIYSKLNIDLPAMRQDLLRQLGDTFLYYEDFIRKSSGNVQTEESSESKLRLLQHHVKNTEWTAQIIPQTKQLITAMEQYALAIFSLNKEMVSLKNERFIEESKGIRFEIEGIAERLTNASTVLTHFISDVIPPSRVRWMDSQHIKSGVNVHLVDAELDIAPRLVEYLFSKFPTIILCSATLTTNKKFDFIKQRFGLVPNLLKGIKITEHIYDSPFDYNKQAMFIIPKDIPQPHESNYHESAVERIWQAIEASKGNAFVLFTSYGMMKSCYDRLSSRLSDNRYVLFKQGDDNRQSLINKFKTTEHSVLFGTDSFWEGVDVSGDALRCVIIVKLPFKVPSEPIIEARTEAISAKGGDPFYDYSLPNAIVKFKQGFGRLIRNKNDRGCIVCLDSRLLNKGYGKIFLNSLPNCRQVFVEGNSISQHMSEFYRKTYYMVQNSNINIQ